MSKPKRYPVELRARSVRWALEQQSTHLSQWATICSIAGKIGCAPETLRARMREAERNQGVRPGLTTEKRQHVKDLEREFRELRRANEVLRKASASSAQAELDRPARCWCRAATGVVRPTGSSRSAGCCRSPRRHTSSTRPILLTPRVGRDERCETNNFVLNCGESAMTTSRSTAYARSGVSCGVMESMWPAARQPARGVLRAVASAQPLEPNVSLTS
jgi:transposase